MIDSTTRRIAELNDLCRKAMGVAGRVFRTQGIAALPLPDQSAIFEKVELFDSFTEDNDPPRFPLSHKNPWLSAKVNGLNPYSAAISISAIACAMALSGSDKIRFFRAAPSAGPCAARQAASCSATGS
jgi:hypothetical protein